MRTPRNWERWLATNAPPSNITARAGTRARGLDNVSTRQTGKTKEDAQGEQLTVAEVAACVQEDVRSSRSRERRRVCGDACALMNVADKKEAAEIEEAWQTHLRDVMGHLDGETDREATTGHAAGR